MWGERLDYWGGGGVGYRCWAGEGEGGEEEGGDGCELHFGLWLVGAGLV